MAEDFVARARPRPKGHYFEDFEIGRRFDHHWGRTLNEGDNSLFTTLTLNFNPLYFNVEFARKAGHPSVVICPTLVFATVFGLTVEDLSENGGAFLGVDDLAYRRPVYPGDTLMASSVVVDRRESTSRKGFGIATWHTTGTNQRGEPVIEFRRTNLVSMRPEGTAGQ